MHLFLTGVLPFLAHNHASAAVFLTCRHHNFHASIIPEFLSDEERVNSFYKARQQNQKIKLPSCYNPDEEKQYKTLYKLFVQTPLMQFSPSLMLLDEDCAESILEPLLETKYFTRSLQRCSVVYGVPLTNEFLQALSKVQSLTKLDLGNTSIENEHLEVIINSFPSLETLTIQNARRLKIVDPSEPAIKFISHPPHATTKTLRSLTLKNWVDPLLAIQFVPYFSNLKKLELFGQDSSESYPELDLVPMTSSLPHLTDLSLKNFTLENTESLKNLVHLSSIQFQWSEISDLSFLTEENHLPHLTKLLVNSCSGLSTSSFASLSHAPNLHVLELGIGYFENDFLQYLENMVHLRKLSLSYSRITGDCGMFKTLMQHLIQLEELNLSGCHGIGNQGAISGALYSTHSRLRVLNLSFCDLDDDDLNGIDALKNTLEVLEIEGNDNLTNVAVAHCRDLMKLNILNLRRCDGINGLSPLKDCLNLEELDVRGCVRLSDDALKVFSEEPNSFPSLRLLDLWHCRQLTEKAFEHLSKNNHLVYQLKELSVDGLSKILLSSATARNNIYQLKGLKRLSGFFSGVASEPERKKLKDELLQSLRNLEQLE